MASLIKSKQRTAKWQLNAKVTTETEPDAIEIIIGPTESVVFLRQLVEEELNFFEEKK